MIAEPRYAVESESGGLLSDFNVGGEFVILVMVGVCFFILGAIFGRSSVPISGGCQSSHVVYGRFGHTDVVTELLNKSSSEAR